MIVDMSIATREQAEAALARVSMRVEVRDDATRRDDQVLPVLPALRPLLPGLRRGHVVEVDTPGALALAVLAGASASGAWCGVVGLPDFGVLAAAGMGCDLERLLLVDDPGERWVEVVAALLEGVEVVLVRPPTPGTSRPPVGVVRRLTALARKAGSCLVSVGPWEGSSARLRVASSLWTGLEQGHGQLRGRRVKVEARGRGADGGRGRSAWLWLPGPDGTVSTADLVSVAANSA